MLTVASLSLAELAAHMAGAGVVLQTGTFHIRLRSAIPGVAHGIHLLYRDYPLHQAQAFADFDVRIARAGGLRRWLRPQVNLYLDGEAIFKPLPLAQAFPMFEWGLNWCVSNHAHSYLIIHAAVLERDGRAVILPAPPGSGKSTLCAALAYRGWRLLSDELTMIRPSNGHVMPLPRPVSLKNASIPLIQAYLHDPVLSPAVMDTVKGTVAHLMPPPASVARSADDARPAWIVFPQYRAGAPAELEVLPKASAYMEVAQNAFNYSVLAAKGFDTLAKVIDMADCYRYTYSALDDGIATFERLAEQS